MKSKYIKVAMNNSNEFRVTASFNLINTHFDDVTIKIDTGCPFTSIPMLKLGIPHTEAYILKLNDCINASIEKNISFGVNDNDAKKSEDRKKFRNKQYMELSSITFRHELSQFFVEGVYLKDYRIKVSYDRTGNILLGMDILKDWDIHIATVASGDTIFMGCPRDQISDEYKCDLESTFGITVK